MQKYAKGAGKGKAGYPPPPPRRMCGELLRLSVSTLTGRTAVIEVSRSQSVVDALRNATVALELPWHRGGVYAMVIGDVKLAEGRDGHCRPMHLYPKLFELGQASGCLVRQPNMLCPGQEVKIHFSLARELQEHPIKQVHGQEGFIRGWLADEDAWLVKMYGGNDVTSIFWIVEPRHLSVRNVAAGTWTTPDVFVGDPTMAPKEDCDGDSALRASVLIDEAIAIGIDLRRRREDDFDRQRRTTEWAARQSHEREARLQDLTAAGPLGAICVGSRARTTEVVDASWEHRTASGDEAFPTGCHVAALAAHLAPRILPLRFGRMM